MKTGFSKEWHSLDEAKKSKITSLQNNGPVPIGAIALSLGLTVRLSTLPVGVSGEIRPDPNTESGFAIKVNRHEAKERQRFTLAHEIAHFLLHKDSIKDGLSDDVLYRSSLSNRKEAEANRLAADILMPVVLVQEWMKQFPDSKIELHIDDIAKYLEVSKLALGFRIGAAEK
jgi:IrrE N-terminal-like domain